MRNIVLGKNIGIWMMKCHGDQDEMDRRESHKPSVGPLAAGFPDQLNGLPLWADRQQPEFVSVAVMEFQVEQSGSVDF